MPSGQSVTIYSGDTIRAIAVDLALPHDSTTEDRGAFLDISHKANEIGSLLISDNQGVQEYQVLSAKVLKRAKYMSKEELRNIKIEIPGLVLPGR